MIVAHAVKSYLFLTGSWVYSQVANLVRYKPVVLCRQIENREIFPFDNVLCYRQKFDGRGYFRIGLRRAFECLTGDSRRFYCRALRRENVSLVHAHAGTHGYAVLGPAVRSGLPLIVAFYGADATREPTLRPIWRRRYERLFRHGTLFLAEGRHMAHTLRNLGCPAEKIRIQHLGVDLRRIAFRPRRWEDIDEPIRFVMAARFREKKGIPYAVQAFVYACRKNPHMNLTVIGGATSAEEKELMRHCRSLAEPIADRVRFTGFMKYPDYLLELERSHILLAPSVCAEDGDAEGGLPVALIEAVAAGLPVIATRHCDIPELVHDGRNGLLVEERDSDGLARAMLTLAGHREAWPALGRHGRAHVESEYNVEKQVPRLEAIYDEALQRVPRSLD